MRRGGLPTPCTNGTSTFGSSARDGAEARVAAYKALRFSSAAAIAASSPIPANVLTSGTRWRGAGKRGCRSSVRGPHEAAASSCAFRSGSISLSKHSE